MWTDHYDICFVFSYLLLSVFIGGTNDKEIYYDWCQIRTNIALVGRLTLATCST